VLAGGVGNGGNINVTSSSLSLINGSRFVVDIDEASDDLPGGQGIGGTVNVNVRDAFLISGTDSGIFGSLGTGAIGRGGNINIQAGNLFIQNGGQIISFTDGKGDAGNISITARDAISLDASSYGMLEISTSQLVHFL
jgi:hypothetical protein